MEDSGKVTLISVSRLNNNSNNNLNNISLLHISYYTRGKFVKSCIFSKTEYILIHDADNNIALASVNISWLDIFFQMYIGSASILSKFAMSTDGTIIIAYEKNILSIYTHAPVYKHITDNIVKYTKVLFGR